MNTLNPEMQSMPAMALRKKRFYTFMFRYVCVIALIGLVLWGVSPWYKIGLNINHSLPGYLYLFEKTKDIHRGDMMAFYPPDNRFYKNTWFTKYAAGVSGDVITVKNREYYIGDKYLGRAKEYSTKNDVLISSMTDGDHIIPDGRYFVWTPHEDSFDSRYEDIGLIKEDAIIGRAYRIF